ncbi:hypothetical protein CALVIDRAFT_537103 [Calocera viscosa TUFC12733]|uniref:BZIP domain-containing protein n=1 Tax=Calocera viscosa (strain TUFC12733) TaxID=1330018 RepID=A0A167M4I6_CALVF|nr:hypothetical protein CALVIDRAFT_537103 [Calocera viscosa TUFC12733]
MEIFNQGHSHPLARIEAPSFPAWQTGAQTQALPDPVSATSTTSAESWMANDPSASFTTPAYESTVSPYQYTQAYDRPWLFSPPSGFRKGLKKTDLRPIHAPTKPRSQLPRASKGASPYARPEPTNPSRQRSNSGSVKSVKAAPSPEQLAKLERRRRANAEAQRLSRQRKEETLLTLRQEVEGLNQRAAALDEDLQRIRQEKVRAEQLLQHEAARAYQLQLEIDRRRDLRRRQVQGNFLQLQAEQGMTPLIGLTEFPNTFWV